MSEDHFRYVPVTRERDYVMHGWMTVAHIGLVRGTECVLMEWTGTGPATDPPVRERTSGAIGMSARERYDGDPPQDQETW
jgi:hypothetical protein